MEAIYQWKNSLLSRNKNEFAQFPEIKWLNPYLADDYNDQRSLLLAASPEHHLYKATKPYHKQLSQGCQACAAGSWSCLFITNKCNAKCFYCPAPQHSDETPSTQGLDFDHPEDYADYINHFGFTGVSFSGGEPLLYFDRTLEFLKTLRRKCSPDLYIWLYTNGILADTEKLKALASENLNEIRFDIGATGFSLDKVKLAKGIIPVITIEIPSVPEEKEHIISMLPQMIEAGVSNLNLHHLRLTTHNVHKLIAHQYTITSAEKPLVVESELAALEILNAAQKNGLEIGINYCSFHYKNRFQKAGFRKIIAQKAAPGAKITENGYLREYDGESITYKSVKLLKKGNGSERESLVKLDETPYTYTIVSLFSESKLSAIQQKQIDEILTSEPAWPPSDPLLFKIWQFEYIERGLRPY